MPEFAPNVVVKLTEDAAASVPYQDNAEQFLPFALKLAWDAVAETIPGITLSLQRAIPDVDPDALRAQIEENAARNGSVGASLTSFFVVPVPAESAEQAAAILNSLPFDEFAYVESEATLPVVNFADDPLVAGQGYFGPAPVGVDMISAWTAPFADGAQVRFVDVEFGWQLDHEDLNDALNAGRLTQLPTGTQTTNANFIDHGTAVLGIVMGQDNTIGIVGAVPAITAMVAPVLTPAGATEIAAVLGFLLTSADVPAGSIALIEQQDANSRPVETDLLIRFAILELTRKGVIVVEASGNGAFDLDTHTSVFFGDTLNPDSGSFFETGAIIVTGASSALPHARLNFTNHGKRIDCYAWGQNILTARRTPNPLAGNLPYTTNFGGSSGASAIVAGVACVLQNVRRSTIGDFLSPAQMRDLLRDATRNTAPTGADVGRIGLMPNLLNLLDAVNSV